MSIDCKFTLLRDSIDERLHGYTLNRVSIDERLHGNTLHRVSIDELLHGDSIPDTTTFLSFVSDLGTYPCVVFKLNMEVL